ncbi:MAG: hypothetical protein EB829_06980 [Nitrosopumilus sp. H8]|nr:MAG: hypothetical protein EB829_06980 [Nitrosopumilus sp. H8]RNJ77331.1 MAG: hypothetical protein EB830_02180 [Nitrosopumilus sp. H13]
MRALFIAGSAVVALGAVFHLQGRSLVGPESSFMYSNPDWVIHGALIALAGAAMIVGALARARS